MSEEEKSLQDVTEILSRVRSEVMGEPPEGNGGPVDSVPVSEVESLHLEELLKQINQEWDLTRYSLESKRKNYAQLVSGFKKMLDLVLKPYANIFLYQQAKYNSHVVQILNLLGQKLGRMEHFLSDISTQQSELRNLFEQKIDEVNNKLDNLSTDMQQKNEQTHQMLLEGFSNSRENLEKQKEYIEEVERRIEQQVSAGEEETRNFIEDGFNATEHSLEQQREYMEQLHDKIMDDLADGLKVSLTEVAQRLQKISGLVDKNRHDLEDKLEQNIDTLLDILTEKKPENEEETDNG